MSQQTIGLKLPFTTHSLTSVLMPSNSKIQQIIRKLETRKEQLIRIMADCKIGRLQSNYSHQQSRGVNEPELKENKKITEIDGLKLRRNKYETKIENQMQEYRQLQTEFKKIEPKILQCVMQIEDYQIQLKKLSEDIGTLYRQALGSDDPNCHLSRKCIYQKIMELETVIDGSELSLRNVLCKFYEELQKQEASEPPKQSLLELIVRKKLVNRLYGYILHNQMSKKPIQKINKQVQSEDQQSCSSSEESNQESLNQQACEYRNKQYHDSWLAILKHMKKLEKMSPQSAENSNQFDLIQFKKDIKGRIDQSIAIKKSIRKLKQEIQEQHSKKNELEQEMKIKEEFMQQLRKKLKQTAAQIEKQVNDGNNKVNAKNFTANYQKQMKQIEEAIRYFSIKKNTAIVPKEQNCAAQVKSIEDFSTTFLSPQKSCVSFQKMLSPDLYQSKKKSQMNKYSLKDLLSPPKHLYTLEKKKAWK